MPNFLLAVTLLAGPLFAFACGIGVGLAIARHRHGLAWALGVLGVVCASVDLAALVWVASAAD